MALVVGALVLHVSEYSMSGGYALFLLDRED